MIKKIWKRIGTILFWLLWPVWFLYFRFYPLRTRVLVIDGSKVLLVKSWIGRNKWSLPGGGAHKKEELETCAVRELREEVGVSVPESALRSLGDYKHTISGLAFHAYYFVAELSEPTHIKKHFLEIYDAQWFELSDIRGRMLDEDAAYALKHYEPINQTSLL